MRFAPPVVALAALVFVGAIVPAAVAEPSHADTASHAAAAPTVAAARPAAKGPAPIEHPAPVDHVTPTDHAAAADHAMPNGIRLTSATAAPSRLAPHSPAAAPPAHAAPGPAAKAPPLVLGAKTARPPRGAVRAGDAPPSLSLSLESGDPGIELAAEGSRVVVRGVAKGPEVKYLEGIYFENGKRVRPVDYEVARGVSFQLDRETMPDFSGDPDYSRKNAWYFAHLATTTTHQGDTAMTIAGRLAASLNKGGAYRATVSATSDGAAEIALERR